MQKYLDSMFLRIKYFTNERKLNLFEIKLVLSSVRALVTMEGATGLTSCIQIIVSYIKESQMA